MADVAAGTAVGDRVPDPANGDHPSEHHSQRPEINSGSRVDSQLLPPLNDTLTDQNSSRATSQPMSKAPSTSSHHDSTKDDASSTAAPYGTRSRNRPHASRPNYAEDQDMDLDLTTTKAERLRRSASHESGSKSRAPSEIARLPTTLRLTTNPGGAVAKPASSTNTPERSYNDSSTDSTHEKKKRKSDRSALPKSAAVGAKDSNSIDRTKSSSNFVASPGESHPDMPPAKKRKTFEDVANSSSSRAKAAIPLPHAGHRETAVVTFENTRAVLNNGKLIADDGTTYSRDDCVYLICEPPGDPYYLCRIMEFRTTDPSDPCSPVQSLLVNWFYRPRDIGRQIHDPRFLFASMQSDESPLNSLRGKCCIKHRSEIQDLDDYRRQRDSFFFTQLYDRYSHRPYEMIPSSAVINVPPHIKKAIDEHWKFLVVEIPRQKELTSAVKLCRRCGSYCAPERSVDCGVCRDTYHMTCVNPPLSRKPSRGFAWSCGPCSRAQERKLEQRHTTNAESEKKREVLREDEVEAERPSSVTPLPDGLDVDHLPEQSSEQAQVTNSNMWPWRYLGVHCRVEDVLQYDDRSIYPRASSRLGPRHQTDVKEWFGRPVELMPPSHLVKKFKGFGKGRDPKVSKEVQAQWQQQKVAQKTRPGWKQDEPPGYVARGEDFEANDPRCTATPIFIKPEIQRPTGFAAVNLKQPGSDRHIDEYMEKARQMGQEWGLVTLSKKGDPQISSNYLDQALKILNKHQFDSSAALQDLREQHSSALLKNPDLNETELKKFEDGVAKHGSDLRSVRKHVKTKTHGEIVRFYYTWKFTRRGDEIWGHNVRRRGRKRRAETSWADIADDEDDSAFDNDKAHTRKRRFQCKHCGCRSSRQWRRAPGVAPGATVPADPKGGKEKANQLIVALCKRCAILWRRYGMSWADPDETARSFVQSGGRQWKKKQEEDWLREIIFANEGAGVPTTGASAAAAANMGIELSVPIETAKKKSSQPSKDLDTTPPASQPAEMQKKKAAPVSVAPPPPPPPPREPTPPIEPNPPKKRELPCAVCRSLDTPAQDQRLECTVCRLNVHKRCYGIVESVNSSHWVCDTCLNDKKQQFLLRYECAACPVADRPVEFFEPPKVSHKKKTDRERERERLEKVLAQAETDAYFKSQRKRGRPQYPREALKLTENSNWMHVVCAAWLPEVKFSNADKLQRAEGMAALINTPRTEQVCKICRREEKAVVSCHQCHAPFHVMCAHDVGYIFGFDVTPVKGSRKDSVSTVTVGSESGLMSAVIWCKDHSPKTIVHQMTEVVDPETGLTAFQLFASAYKQADLTLTGTARKAILLQQSTRLPILSAPTSTNRRVSTMPNGTKLDDAATVNGATDHAAEERRCTTCATDSSLKWHQAGVDEEQNVGSVWQCHRCHMLDKENPRPSSADIPSDNSNNKPLEEEPDLFRTKRPAWSGDAGMAYLQHFADELKKTTITLTNPKFGGLHIFQGKDLNLDLDSDPRSAFRLVIYQASVRCGYDQERDVIITEDGSWVTFPKSMMQALVKMIVAGSREGHWRVVSAREVPCKLMANIYVPPGPENTSSIAPFPPHLAPPSFNGPTTSFPPRQDTFPSMIRFPPIASGPAVSPGSFGGPSIPPAPGVHAPPMPNGVPRNAHGPPLSMHNGMPAPYQQPNGISPPPVGPPPPPGYQPAMSQAHPAQASPPQVPGVPQPPLVNGTPTPGQRGDGPAAGASSSPNLQNLLRP